MFLRRTKKAPNSLPNQWCLQSNNNKQRRAPILRFSMHPPNGLDLHHWRRFILIVPPVHPPGPEPPAQKGSNALLSKGALMRVPKREGVRHKWL